MFTEQKFWAFYFELNAAILNINTIDWLLTETNETVVKTILKPVSL